MFKPITVIPIDTRNELELHWVSFPDESLMGINGYFKPDVVLPFFDIDSPHGPDMYCHIRDVMTSVKLPCHIMQTRRGYHIIGFTPIPLDTWLRLAFNLGCCRKFVGYTLVRGYPTLRMTLKPLHGEYDILLMDTLLFRATEWQGFSRVHLDAYLPVKGKNATLYFGKDEWEPIPYKGNIPITQFYR